MGGKHRYLIGGADMFVDDDPDAFRRAAIEALLRPARLGLDTLAAEQARLQRRLQRFGACADGRDVWRALGIDSPETTPELPTAAFQALAALNRESADDAR
jgi:malonate decarboxylase beta subunit